MSESLRTRLIDLTSSWCLKTLSSRTGPKVGRVPRESPEERNCVLYDPGPPTFNRRRATYVLMLAILYQYDAIFISNLKASFIIILPCPAPVPRLLCLCLSVSDASSLCTVLLWTLMSGCRAPRGRSARCQYETTPL